jgi:hypothetical protein
MTDRAERVLTDELAQARVLLEQALAILDQHEEAASALQVCEAIEILVGAPSVMEQWCEMTGRNPDGSLI